MLQGTSVDRAREFLAKLEGIDYGAWLYVRHAVDQHFTAKKDKLERELVADASLQLEDVGRAFIP